MRAPQSASRNAARASLLAHPRTPRILHPTPKPMKALHTTLLTLTSLITISHAATQPFTGIQKTVLQKQGDNNVHTYRIPGLTTTKAGTLIAVFDLRHKNGADLPGDIDIAARRSTDHGQTWSPAARVLDFDNTIPNSHGNGVGDPCILADLQTGTLFVAGLWSFGDKGWNSSKPGMSPDETGQFILSRSDDDGRTWSKPINITTQIKQPEWQLCLQGPGRGIQLRNGTLVMPAQFKEGRGDRIPHSYFIYSQDHGNTWKPSPPVVAPGQLPWTTEAQIAELSNGQILISMRNHHPDKQRAWATFQPNPINGSLDGGQWSPVRYNLNDPTCAAGLVHLPASTTQDHLILCSHADSKTHREHMTVRLSRDNGNTWPVSRLIDKRPSAYSCLTILADGSIGLLYESGNNHPYEELVFARFTLDWLKENTSTP
jgi:sialidase-1